MKKIILASASPQRKKLLKLAGIKFIVRPSHAEEATELTTTCSAFVKHNAVLKARSVAETLKDGLVIGADTIVYAHGQIIGKPKDIDDAKRILKVLASHPQWVYTGIAVIDVASGKTKIDYEKTKIFMHRLSDHEIDRYHSITSPLDKAGGFDIEGRGGFFINRIEGCYSNVIGLPMAKLRMMLKEFGVSLLAFLLMVMPFSGCATEYNLATGKEESLMYGTDKEVAIGDSVSQQLESQVEINTDVDVNERVQKILDRIAAVCDRHDIVYVIKVIEEDKVNAVSLPGGYIYVYKGLLDKVKNDDQLAGVVAHEVGHITAKHGIKRQQASYGALLLQLAAFSARNAELAMGANAIFSYLFFAYSRQDEYQADQLGVKYLKKAGYDPREMVHVLEILQTEQRKGPAQPASYFRTHPYIPERIGIVNKAISGQIDFRGYLNLTGNEGY